MLDYTYLRLPVLIFVLWSYLRDCFLLKIMKLCARRSFRSAPLAFRHEINLIACYQHKLDFS